MATIRSPKGFALTVLATLTIVVLAIGWLERGSNPELAEQAALLRIPTMALLTVAAGAGAWTVLALASYWIRISPVIILGSFLVGVPPTYDSYENWSWSSWPSNTFEAETLTSISREGPTGVWRGITGGEWCYPELSRLSIREDGSVIEERWSLYPTSLFPILHALRIIPDEPPSLNTGRVVGNTIIWDTGYRSPHRSEVWRSGDTITLDFIPIE